MIMATRPIPLTEDYIRRTIAAAAVRRPALAKRYREQLDQLQRIGYTIEELVLHSDPAVPPRSWKQWSIVPASAVSPAAT
jgi:hypothetical protein